MIIMLEKLYKNDKSTIKYINNKLVIINVINNHKKIFFIIIQLLLKSWHLFIINFGAKNRNIE